MLQHLFISVSSWTLCKTIYKQSIFSEIFAYKIKHSFYDGIITIDHSATVYWNETNKEMLYFLVKNPYENIP